MGIIKNTIVKTAQKAGDTVAKLSTLSPEQLEKIRERKEEYLADKPNPTSEDNIEQTNRLLASSGVEIFNAYLPQIKDLYLPLDKNAEYEGSCLNTDHNIRYINITKWVTEKKENSLEKLINVYAVLTNEHCNIALIFNRKQSKTNVFLAVVNTDNDDNNRDVTTYIDRLTNAIKGNFPGSEISEPSFIDSDWCLSNDLEYSVASASNIPNEKSEKFISQTIEKLLDGIIPSSVEEEYTLVLIATPVADVEDRKVELGTFYSALAPFSSWQTNFTYSETMADSSTATVGVNVGASVGRQAGTGSSLGNTDSEATTESQTDTEGSSDTAGAGVQTFGVGGNYSHQWQRSTAKTAGKTLAKALSTTKSVTQSASLGANFGANFARSSTVSEQVGKNEGIFQNFTNYNIKHALELLEAQMKRLDTSSALGMWDFGVYVLSEDHNVANNVAHTYLALTLGEESYMSQSAVNLWRGKTEEDKFIAKEICDYIRELRHPIFGMKPALLDIDSDYSAYPSVVTATTCLSGKELAYSLNFPQKSISGLPVIECADFGRNISTYDNVADNIEKFELGKIYHMNHIEDTEVELSKNSLSSHMFVTGSTGSGKSNTVYQIINKLHRKNVKFMVIEPAKGEYKNVFGSQKDVFVYGTNPKLTPLLRINPFSFPEEIHVLEHMDKLIEIFNVCWPMYAAMPAVLKSAVEKSYEDAGWDLVLSINTLGERIFPTFKDVASNIKEIIDSSEYDSENKGAYKGSLLTRLRSLTNGINGMIFGSDEIDSEQLFNENVIVDISRVGSTETKSLIMGMLVLKLQEFRISQKIDMNSDLKHITVLEEAHNILRRTSTEQSQDGANLSGKSVEMIANVIAEMRTYGEGFIVADQAPGLMDMSVIRNTNTKIIMRLPDQSDRELVGRAANLNEEQIAELAKLPCGVAAVYQNEWIDPVLCKVNRYDKNVKNYVYDVKDVDNLANKEKELETSLLDIIMNKSINNKNDKKDMKNLKNAIISSMLEAKVKRNFIEYLNEEKNPIDGLRPLIFDFLNAKNAIDASQKVLDINEWTRRVVDGLSPSIKNYSDKQIDLAMALITYELANRQPEYRDLFIRFTEVYKNDGKVF